jgi:hypothetical protein
MQVLFKINLFPKQCIGFMVIQKPNKYTQQILLLISVLEMSKSKFEECL